MVGLPLVLTYGEVGPITPMSNIIQMSGTQSNCSVTEWRSARDTDVTMKLSVGSLPRESCLGSLHMMAVQVMDETK